MDTQNWSTAQLAADTVPLGRSGGPRAGWQGGAFNSCCLEVWAGGGAKLVRLEGERLTLGRDEVNDIAMPADPTMSRLHAVMEHYPTGWCVRDLGSCNGTLVNGQRLWQERALKDGDEVRAGAARLVYREGAPDQLGLATQPKQSQRPQLTRREREVLALLCRPVLDGPFTEPASTRDLAEALVVSEAAVKQHLLHLYDKFGIHGQGERRRARLANEALHSGVVTLADLRDQNPPT